MDGAFFSSQQDLVEMSGRKKILFKINPNLDIIVRIGENAAPICKNDRFDSTFFQ